jgi:hypothetical protein
MVRELSFSTSIPGCDTRAFYEIACAPSEPVRAFHLSVDPDDDVVVSGWDETGTRSVCFTLSMAVPPTVQRFIGAERCMIYWHAPSCYPRELDDSSSSNGDNGDNSSSGGGAASSRDWLHRANVLPPPQARDPFALRKSKL